MRVSKFLGLGVGLVLLGCGGGGGRADVDMRPMPPNSSYTGVYNSPQYGRMDLVQQGSQVIGEYHKDERTGRIQGTVSQNVLRFEWSERRELISGRPNMTRGRGYFQYLVDANGDHVIVGEWGHDDNETGGGPWRAVKSRRQQPQLSPETTGGEGEQSDWDRDDSGGGEGLPPEDSGGGGMDSGDDSGGGEDDGLDGLDL